MDTPVVILDEPTTGQDARGIERVHRVVSDLAAAGRTVVAISHDMRFVADAFERVVVMRDGRIVLDGSPADVFAEAAWPTLESTFLEPPSAARIGHASASARRRPTRALLAALGVRRRMTDSAQPQRRKRRSRRLRPSTRSCWSRTSSSA
jgi:energy-coupling factor transport system ATP-binding protein